MARVSRAFVLASGERYASVVINLGSTAVLSRLLTPAEFGVVVVGFSAAAFAEGVRELSASSYIVQAPKLDRDGLRSVFVINAGFTLAIAAALYLLARPLADFYAQPPLGEFLQVFALGFALSPTGSPAAALMARNMAFGRRGAAALVVTAVNTGAAIAFALMGFSYMSFAWAYVLSNAVSAVIYPVLLRDWTMFGLSLRDWRAVLSFGLYGGATRLLYIASENASFLVMGRYLSPSGIALLFRAGMLVTFPDRVLLGAASAVALPAFSEEARKNAPVGRAYVRAVEMLTAVYWPALVVIGLLAHPIVALFLGAEWTETAVYVQIMAGAALFSAPMSLNQPVQVATGAIRATPVLALFHLAMSVGCIALAAPYGPPAVAWSVWISAPINVTASVWLVRRVAPFPLRDMMLRLLHSAVAALGAAAGPLAVIAAHGWRFDLPWLPSLLALVLAGAGWLAALVLSRHPLTGEAVAVLQRVRARLTAA